MRSKRASLSSYEVHRMRFFSLRLVTMIVGVIAIGATSLLWFGNFDICGGASGWWIGAVLGSPVVFAGFCTWCAVVAPGDIEKGSWVAAAALLILLYLPALTGTLVSAGVAGRWC